MSRRLIKEEGLLCGGSSGTAMHYAIEAAKDLGMGAGQRVVVLLPDSIRNYMTKFLSDDWMEEREFYDVKNDDEGDKTCKANDNLWWWKLSVSALSLQAPLTVHPNVTIQETLTLLNKEGFDQVPVVDDSGEVQGMATVGHMMSQVMKGKVTGTDSVSNVIYKQFKQITVETTLGQLSRMLDTDHYVLVVHDQRQYQGNGSMSKKKMIFGIATRIDLLNFITKSECASE